MEPLDGRRPPRRRGRKIFAALLVAVGLLATLRIGGEPSAELTSDLPGIGPETRIVASAFEPVRGLERWTLELIQGEQVTRLAGRELETRPAWKFWGPLTAEDGAEVTVGHRVTQGLTAGEARIRLSAWRAGTWLRSPGPVVRELVLPVRLTPPQLGVLSSQHYPTQGGSEAVVYRVGETAIRHGVEAGGAFFPGYPLPGGLVGERFALFAVPFDLPAGTQIRLVAEDDVGNRAQAGFVDRLKPRELRSDRINVSDTFIGRVAPEIEAQTPGLEASGSLADRYVAINSGLRVDNRGEIAALADATLQEFLWKGAFEPLANGQVMARFADHRTYLYDGSKLDAQVHLGYDLASVKHAPVPAANAGVVVMAQYLGIYGNVVVLDHGFGLMTLYGHLSSFEVSLGARVTRGQTLGRTGVTGLAGGDHLHFGVFLHGTATDPVEWLDASWIQNRLARKLGFGEEAAE